MATNYSDVEPGCEYLRGVECDNRSDAYCELGMECAACDPWCQKCPIMDICLKEGVCPQSQFCEEWRYEAGQLAFSQMDPWWQDMTREPWYKAYEKRRRIGVAHAKETDKVSYLSASDNGADRGQDTEAHEPDSVLFS